MDTRATDVWGIQSYHLAWIKEFTQIHGRSPRVLGIGNIANNGFRNAVALRQYGVECDVLCYSYLHIMACPEWEAARFEAERVDEFRPIWSQVDLGDYERPRWFAQGQLGTCLDYLIAFREKDEVADTLWQRLAAERDAGQGEASTIYAEAISQDEIEVVTRQIARRFTEVFPQRRDRLTSAQLRTDFQYVLEELPRFRRLLSLYDVIIAYSTDGLIPLLANKSNYIAYEHGTIRAIPFQRDVQGRMCALTYAMAGNVVITNCDNIVAAERLGLRRFGFAPHAILETWADGPHGADLRSQLLMEHDADFLVFHPSRQHWGSERDPNYDKGNDILIKGFASFVKERRPRALLILVEWGQKVAKTRQLIDELGIERRVLWLKPKPIRILAEYIAASNVLADQFTIGAFGGILPIGLLMQTPTLIYLNEELHRWCFPQMPPVLNARAADEVFKHLVQMQDERRAQALAAAGRQWYDTFHSTSVVAGRLLDAIIPLVAKPKDEFALDPYAVEISGFGPDIFRQPDPVELQADHHSALVNANLNRISKQAERHSALMNAHVNRISEQFSQDVHNIGKELIELSRVVHGINQHTTLIEQRYRKLRMLLSPFIWLAKCIRAFQRSLHEA